MSQKMPTLLMKGNEYCIKSKKKKREKKKKTKERDDTMAAITKPNNGAFVLNGSKVKEFFERKTNTSSDALKRFEERKPKDGIVTPFKR